LATSFARNALALSFAAAAASCGPVGATSVIHDAEVAAARAHAADGDRYAIYETTSADLYLQKAREEQGRARYGEAAQLARKSIDLAEQASQKASAQRASGPSPVAPRATIQHTTPASKPSPASTGKPPPASTPQDPK
jgi:hypothetical protein